MNRAKEIINLAENLFEDRKPSLRKSASDALQKARITAMHLGFRDFRKFSNRTKTGGQKSATIMFAKPYTDLINYDAENKFEEFQNDCQRIIDKMGLEIESITDSDEYRGNLYIGNCNGYRIEINTKFKSFYSKDDGSERMGTIEILMLG